MFFSNKFTAPSMADIFEKAKNFASESAKAKVNCKFIYLFILFYLFYMTAIMLSVSVFGQVLHYFRYSVSATNFYFSAY